MSETTETIHKGGRRFYNVSKMRVHDYLYDTAYIVSGARDYARSAFKAAMASAQVTIQPVYEAMFSDLNEYPRVQMVYYANCRLPGHVDRSYEGYLQRAQQGQQLPVPEPGGRDRFKFVTMPRKVFPLRKTSPRFRPPSPAHDVSTKPVNKGVQTLYRESSAQTHPWQPDGKAADFEDNTPEVLYLDKLDWGPGKPYRTGDLPVDFHTTEIINKMRHARRWMELVERGDIPEWIKRRDAIIEDVETKDWIFREAEIDELQEIRLTLLHKITERQRQKASTRLGRKLSKRWDENKKEMERKIDRINKARDREIRKLTALHTGGGRLGLVGRLRAARGSGSVTSAAIDPASDQFAPVARNGYQARRRHARIVYDASLLAYEDHEALSKPPAWLERCAYDLQKSCSGHDLPKARNQLCERETKWSELMLKNLHDELKRARLGAAQSATTPLHVLKPRRTTASLRPATPETGAVRDDDETCHQAALMLQRVVRGRAAQILMYEGRTRAAELTEELKTTHGLQKEDKLRIAREEARAREYDAVRTDAEKKDDAITALVDELCGGAVSAALDFLEKELKRLQEERKQHAYVLIALREKTMREAAEAGRRQKELHRRREHDEVFKQVLGVTQETVDVYLREVLAEGVELSSEEQAVERAKEQAEKIEASLLEHGSMSTAEQNEVVAELVQHFLLPQAQKLSSRNRIAATQESNLRAAREEIFGLLDNAEDKTSICTRCGEQLGTFCRCAVCPISLEPVEKPEYRDDPRWKLVRRPASPTKTLEERYPPAHEIRCMLNVLVDEAVVRSREHRENITEIREEYCSILLENIEMYIESQAVLEDGPSTLPTVIRDEAERKRAEEDPACRCDDTVYELDTITPSEKADLLPTHLRALADKMKCKCDEDDEKNINESVEMAEADTVTLKSETATFYVPPPPSVISKSERDQKSRITLVEPDD